MNPAAFLFLVQLTENDSMDLSTIANVATALTVITGVGFGLVEAQRSRRARQERAAYAAVQAILYARVDEVDDRGAQYPGRFDRAGQSKSDAGVLNAAHSVGVILEATRLLGLCADRSLAGRGGPCRRHGSPGVA